MTAPNSEAWLQFLRDQAERQTQAEQLAATQGGTRPVPAQPEENGAGVNSAPGYAETPRR